MNRLRLGILISGRGSNMLAIADAIQRGDLDSQIALVVSNNPDAAGLETARRRGLPTAVINRRDGRSREARHDEMASRLDAAGIGLVVLAGFDEILSAQFVERFGGRMMNVHPSLLPAFGGGMHAQRDALEHGVKVSGCTVHFVTRELQRADEGPIILQRTVPVHDDDTEETLADRILIQEHLALPEAIGLFAAGRLRIEGRRVRLLPAPVGVSGPPPSSAIIG